MRLETGGLGFRAVLPFVLAVLAATPAAAAPSKPALPPRAALFVVGANRDQAAAAEQLEVKVSKALEDAKVDLVDLRVAVPRARARRDRREAVRRAKKAWDNMDYSAPAVDKCERALVAFTQHPETADAATLADVHLFIGAVSMQLNGKAAAKKAQEAFARALLFNPDLQFDAQVYGADAKKIFDRARQDVASKGMGALTLASSPAGATVTLRDKPIGLTPLAEAPSVPVGRHLVKFSRPGFATTGAFADVASGGATVNAVLPPAPGGYGEARDAALPSLAADGISTGKVPPTAKKQGFVDRPSPLAPAVVEVEQGGGTPVYKKWWFWTAVGVVVVGSATAVGVAVACSNSGYNVVLGTP